MPAYLDNPFYAALTGAQAAWAVSNGPALRYQPDVIPFGAVAEPSSHAMQAIHDLLAPGESLFLTGEHDSFPRIPGLQKHAPLPGLQMLYDGPPLEADGDTAEPRIEPLSLADADDMLALKTIAFPGYFARRAVELGSFFGIRDPHTGELVAMAGERLATSTHREVSALCTHPAHTGRGYGRRLMLAVQRAQQRRGVQTMLHVIAANARAIAIYERLGYVTTGTINFQRFMRVDPPSAQA